MANNYEIGQKIKNVREELGLTLQDVADKVGVASSTIQRYESGNILKIKLPVINAISLALNVNPSWIIGKSTNRNIEVKGTLYDVDKDSTSFLVRETSEDSYSNSFVKIPVFASARKNGSFKDQCNRVDDEYIPKNWLTEGQEYTAFKASDDSMYPKYENGDIVVVRLQSDFESGQDCIVSVNGYDATLKTVIKDGRNIILKPRNPEWQPKVYPLEEIKILGVVKRLIRNF